jgi:N-methylhydantoinase A
MYRVSVDTGGTFTDVVVTDGRGRFVLGKAPTTPGRSFEGIAAALKNAAEQIGVTPSELVADTAFLVYGTTQATNAIVERKTAKTALLVTKGFRDTLIYRNGGKLNASQLTPVVPPPYIPRRLTFTVSERINAEGEIEFPLDVAEVRLILKDLKCREIEAIAVSLIWSIANPIHEEMIGTLIQQELPNIPYTLSSALNPIIREYPRTSSAAIDASLKPLMQTHLRNVQADLETAGFTGELLVSASSGGVMYIEDMAEKPVYMAKSGPAMAPVAALAYAGIEEVTGDIIIVDTGGTTFDVSLIRNGSIKHTMDTWLGPPLVGTLLGIATVDIRSVGAGGGSIAWVDAGGLLRVGPRSAGSVPGPACYGRGGQEATVTDAAVVLGYIDPLHFLGGRMTLDRSAAVAAISPVAEVIGKSVEVTAAAILRLASEIMIKAIEDITIRDGVHPRNSVLVAGGGAAGLNILSIARSLRCRSVIIPKTAGAISASGGQFSDVAIDFSASRYASTTGFDHLGITALLGSLCDRASAFEEQLRARGVSRFVRRLFVQARYERQQFEMEVELPAPWVAGAIDLATLRHAYDEQCRRLYLFSRPDAAIETITWRLRVVAVLPRPAAAMTSARRAHPESRLSTAFFGDHGFVRTTVLDGSTIPARTEIRGPTIIEEPTTTIVVEPGTYGHLSENGNYVFEGL